MKRAAIALALASFLLVSVAAPAFAATDPPTSDVDRIEMSVADSTLKYDQTTTYTVTVHYENGTSEDVTSEADVTTSSGLSHDDPANEVTAISDGDTTETITAEYEGLVTTTTTTTETYGPFYGFSDGQSTTINKENETTSDTVEFIGNTSINVLNTTEKENFSTFSPYESNNVTVENGNLTLGTETQRLAQDSQRDFTDTNSASDWTPFSGAEKIYPSSYGESSDGFTIDYVSTTLTAKFTMNFTDGNDYVKYVHDNGTEVRVYNNSGLQETVSVSLPYTMSLNDGSEGVTIDGSQVYNFRNDVTTPFDLKIEQGTEAQGTYEMIVDKGATSSGFNTDGTDPYEETYYIEGGDSGYATYRYNETNVQEAKLNWTTYESGGDVDKYVKVGGSYVEWTDIEEDQWKDLVDGDDVYVRMNLTNTTTAPKVDDFAVEYTYENTVKSEDPTLSVNGTQVASYTGTLNDGESVNITISQNISDGPKVMQIGLAGGGVVDWEYKAGSSIIGVNQTFTNSTTLTAAAANMTSISLAVPDEMGYNETAAYTVYAYFENDSKTEKTGGSTVQSSDPLVLAVDSTNETLVSNDTGGIVTVNATYNTFETNESVTVSEIVVSDCDIIGGECMAAIASDWTYLYIFASLLIGAMGVRLFGEMSGFGVTIGLIFVGWVPQATAGGGPFISTWVLMATIFWLVFIGMLRIE